MCAYIRNSCPQTEIAWHSQFQSRISASGAFNRAYVPLSGVQWRARCVLFTATKVCFANSLCAVTLTYWANRWIPQSGCLGVSELTSGMMTLSSCDKVVTSCLLVRYFFLQWPSLGWGIDLYESYCYDSLSDVYLWYLLFQFTSLAFFKTES